jgi:hypothetical protein
VSPAIDACREEVKQPSMLAGGDLRPYQLDGLRFLVSLWNNSINGEPVGTFVVAMAKGAGARLSMIKA